jgi:stearoyl-CoA desaturase (delta-9 desaturase)
MKTTTRVNEEALIDDISSESLHFEDNAIYNSSFKVADAENVSISSKYLQKGQLWHAILITNLIPTFGFIATLVSIWYWGVGVMEVTLLFVGYFLTMMGAEIGFHRLFTHRSFKTKKFLEVSLAILACMCAQGPLIYWVANHRRHHQHSDKEGDPHSPHLFGNSFTGILKGLWYSHIAWQAVHEIPNTAKFANDLLKDPVLRKINKHYFLWVVLGVVIPTLIGGLVTMSWQGAVSGLLWGGLTRIFLVNHATFSLNSICHVFGSRPFSTKEYSRNNIWLVIPTLGQGWHNNHHAFPYSASVSFDRWQIDPSLWVIKCWGALGLAWDIKVPNKQHIEEIAQKLREKNNKLTKLK